MGKMSFRGLASMISGRASIASKAGLTFGNERDLFSALGYKRDLDIEDYFERFKRNAIAGRIVEALPKATWRGEIQVIEDEDPDTVTPFEEEWQKLEDRLNVWAVFLRADILAGIGRFAVVLIGAPGEFEEPLDSLGSVDDILYLTPFSENDVSVKALVEETDDSRFGLPELYKFKRISKTERLVHWTRVLHVADGILDEQLYGEPRLRRCWNLLDDLEKVTGSGAEAFWLRAHQGYQVDVDPEAEMQPADYDDLQNEVESFVHGLKRFVRTRGVDMTVLGSDVANFANQADSILTQISGGTGIPKRILTGSEMGELASSQDKTNWDERVSDRRDQYAAPQVVGPFVNHLIELGALPEVESFEVRWPMTSSMDEEERAGVADKLSGLNKKMNDTVITASEIRERVLELPPIEEVEDDPLNDESFVEEEEEEESADLEDAAAKSPLSRGKKTFHM
jgi:hypothetical protein